MKTILRRTQSAFRPAVAFAVTLGVSLQGCGGNSGSTEPASRDGKLINGMEVAEGAGSQFVQIEVSRVGGSTLSCTGTVIGPESILTAGHCFTVPHERISVRWANGEMTATGVTRHPGYVESNELGAIFNDVAIVTAATGLPELPILATADVPLDTPLSIFGYGLNEDGESGTLLSGTVELAGTTPNHLVGEPFEGTGQNSCYGDSGAPVIATTGNPAAPIYGIVGTVSTGSGVDCGPGDVTLYANLQNPEIASFIAATAPGAALVR